MSASERNFNSFHLGDNVYELAGGLIPEIADRVGVPLGEQPSSESLGALVSVLGTNKVLRNNEIVSTIDLSQAARFVEKSGVQEALQRSLWHPKGLSRLPISYDATIATGGVANWQDRTAQLIVSDSVIHTFTPVYLPTGNRIMNSPSEVKNENVTDFMDLFGAAPTESQYAEQYVAPILERAGVRVDVIGYDTQNGDEIAQRFILANPNLFEPGNPWDLFEEPTRTRLNFARVANAGIQLAVQFRKAAQAANAEFDVDRGDPQVFIQTDSLPVAQTETQLTMLREYQSPFTALRQVALTAKMLHEA
jgi:hypothetical protein